MRGTRAKKLRKEAYRQYISGDMYDKIDIKTHQNLVYAAFNTADNKFHIKRRSASLRLRDKLGKAFYNTIKTIFAEWMPVSYKWGKGSYRRIYKDLKKEYKRGTSNN